MVKELAENIKEEVFKTLDSIYNHRKEKEGLVSCHNVLIRNLKKIIESWVEAIGEDEKRISKITFKENKK